MAVASEMKHKTSPSTDSLPYSPSKNGSETSAAADLSDHNDQSESSSQHHRRGEGDVDILLSPAYLKSEEYRLLFRLPPDEAHERLKHKNLENVNDTCPAPHQIHSNLQLEPNEDQKGPESLHDARNVPQIPVMVSHSQDVNSRVKGSVHGNPSSASFSASLFGDSLTRLCLYLKNQVHFPLVLVVASVLMLLLMQVEYMNNIANSRGEAVAWLEKQVHHLKDEMSMVEARLEKMRHEHVLLKGHLKAFEQLKE